MLVWSFISWRDNSSTLLNCIKQRAGEKVSVKLMIVDPVTLEEGDLKLFLSRFEVCPENAVAETGLPL